MCELNDMVGKTVTCICPYFEGMYGTIMDAYYDDIAECLFFNIQGEDFHGTFIEYEVTIN